MHSKACVQLAKMDVLQAGVAQMPLGAAFTPAVIRGETKRREESTAAACDGDRAHASLLGSGGGHDGRQEKESTRARLAGGDHVDKHPA